MLSEKENTRISKFLSLVLRHQPEHINLSLNTNGWAKVEELITLSANAGVVFSFDELKHIVETNNKKRFAFNEDCTLIRASQGHSVAIDSGYTAQEPPEVLYHGTAIKNLDSILANGLNKGNRLHVHLSSDKATAVNVGSRHGKPVVLEVMALQMHKDGFHFYLSDNKVWLTDSVPVKYLKMPAL
ncbi:RNA 2'-phosphotransferase [Flavobacterium alkalisoli]|uniref:Probable RNA 2'-phosphotransferase n=1 Tax=Flavobacterium alkalisoli TaxID=2602769 RepID=A0A5B9FYN2_9FLAO|nr:RNA 2'-phosphotransferase [Flavobacterium alkalisoli]QEE50002.1 RNA 2'-phosphotransferase [Flavobacterium alkalisoli]